MLKMLTALTLLITVVSPGCRAEISKAEHPIGRKHRALPASPVVSPELASPAQRSGIQPQSNSEKETYEVRIVGTPQKDFSDKAGVWLNAGLVLVGFGGIVFAARTLRAIQRQANTLDAQAAHMGNQLDEMRRQADFSAKEMAASQRPWISPTVVLSGPLQNTPNGPTVTVDIMLENVGNTPAVGIEIRPVLYVMHVSKPSPIAERKRICEEIKNTPPDWGEIIFPNKTLVQRYTFGTTDADIQAHKIGDRYVPEIIICIAYRSTFDEAARYHTGATYTLSKFEPTHPQGTFALIVGEELSTDGLRIFSSAVSPIIAH